MLASCLATYFRKKHGASPVNVASRVAMSKLPLLDRGGRVKDVNGRGSSLC